MNHRHWDSLAQVDSVEAIQIGRDTERYGVRDSGFQTLVLGVLSLVVVFSSLAGCSTSPAKTQQQQTPVIAVALTQAPPKTLPVGTSAQVAATVTSDPANAGVDWVATCASAPNCGIFSPVHTDSGTATTFTAPPAVPSQNTISVTALSSTDHSKAAAFLVTVVSNVTSITITQPATPKVPAGSIVTVAAAVVGDPGNLGVDWKATCGFVDCTPSSGLHSTSGSPLYFTVPSTLQISTIVGTSVKLTAFATADHSFTAITTFLVGSPIGVVITQAPPVTMVTNATATLVATVQNDPSNSGVIWSFSCATAPCGDITPAQTPSGAPAIFTAPATVPGNPQNPSPVVTITAQSVAGGLTSNYTVNVTIVAPVSVKISQGVQNGTIVQNRTAALVATVTNDATDAGLDWTAGCGSPGNCGTFSPTHTASDGTTIYTAPPSMPTGGSVTITATSTADQTKFDTQTVTVTASPPPNALLTGQFVMLLSAQNSVNGAFVLGGVISGDGQGTLPDATLNLADASGNANTYVHLLSPGSYSIGPDGRGQMHFSINTAALNNSFGVNGTGALTLSVVFVTPQHAVLSETDTFGTATGTLDLQSTQGFPGLNGPYSLRLSGVETASPTAAYFVASALTVNSTISYSYVTDQSDNGAVQSVAYTAASSGLNPQANGYGGYTLRSVNLGLPTQFTFDLWPIDSTHMVAIDVLDSVLGSPNVIVSGNLTAQPSSPTPTGTYAFTETGANAAAQPQVVGGILTCGGTGTLDVVPLAGAGLSNQAVSATCSALANGRGVIVISGAGSSGISQFAAYPTSDQGVYLIELDGGTSGTSGSSGAGIALQQSLTPPIVASALSGQYASSFIAKTALGSQAFAAQISSDGAALLTGIGDISSFNTTVAPSVATPSSGATFSGSYTSSSDGRFPLGLTIAPASGQAPPQIANLNPACYLVDANSCLLLSLDTTAPGTGILQLQNTGL